MRRQLLPVVVVRAAPVESPMPLPPRAALPFFSAPAEAAAAPAVVCAGLLKALRPPHRTDSLALLPAAVSVRTMHARSAIGVRLWHPRRLAVLSVAHQFLHSDDRTPSADKLLARLLHIGGDMTQPCKTRA